MSGRPNDLLTRVPLAQDMLGPVDAGLSYGPVGLPSTLVHPSALRPAAGACRRHAEVDRMGRVKNDEFKVSKTTISVGPLGYHP